MNSKQRKALELVFRDPPSGNIRWDVIEGLLVAVGCEVIEGRRGVSFVKDGKVAYFHRPHPHREALIYRVKEARAFMIRLGVQP
jgi:hypothetical protein